MSVDLIIHAGTKFALHQWLDARGLGSNVQDTDPESPTFGEYTYTHEVGTFYYWNHPSGKVPATYDDSDPENVVTTDKPGFYARLSFPSFEDMPATLTDWVANNTAVSVLDGIAGVGGEGVTILEPEQLYAAVEAIGAPVWGGLLGVGNTWSDPRLWAFSNVMTGDQRDFGGQTYESLIDFNVWSPEQYPQGWLLVETPEPGIQEWAPGLSVTVGEQYTYRGSTYQVIQSHTTLAGWQPPNVPALWQLI